MEEQNKKNLKTFSWASFLNDFGSDIIFPLWPIFLSSIMGANMAVIGLIDGLGDAIVSISQAVSARPPNFTFPRYLRFCRSVCYFS